MVKLTFFSFPVVCGWFCIVPTPEPAAPRLALNCRRPFGQSFAVLNPGDPLHNSSRVRVGRIGMGCKADFAGITQKFGTAIGKKFNAADHPVPNFRGLSRAARGYAEGSHGRRANSLRSNKRGSVGPLCGPQTLRFPCFKAAEDERQPRCGGSGYRDAMRARRTKWHKRGWRCRRQRSTCAGWCPSGAVPMQRPTAPSARPI